MFRPVFGCSLEDHLRVNDREIAFVIEECILYLLDCGLDVEVSIPTFSINPSGYKDYCLRFYSAQ